MTDSSIELPSTPEVAKAQAKRLKSALSPNYEIPHGQALELIARVHGEKSWGRLNSLLSKTSDDRSDPGYKKGDKSPSAREYDGRTRHVDQRFLKAFSRGLQFCKHTSVSPKALEYAEAALKDEIIPMIAIEEWLDTLDKSMGQMIFEIGAKNFLKIAKIETVARYKRPRGQDTGVSGYDGLRPIAFANVLIWMERMGFDTHPEVFCKPLKKEIRKHDYIDSAELSCLWHDKENKSRFQTSEFFFDPSIKEGEVEKEILKGRNKLTIEIEKSTDPDGPIRSIRIYR